MKRLALPFKLEKRQRLEAEIFGKLLEEVEQLFRFTIHPIGTARQSARVPRSARPLHTFAHDFPALDDECAGLVLLVLLAAPFDTTRPPVVQAPLAFRRHSVPPVLDDLDLQEVQDLAAELLPPHGAELLDTLIGAA